MSPTTWRWRVVDATSAVTISQRAETLLPPQEIPLFHPVQDVSAAERGPWTLDGQWIGGTTALPRATVEQLDLNDERHANGFIRMSRALWVRGGWHPPTSEPVLPEVMRSRR